ncbi:hypothetical protein SpCBS45565_g01306 [Spizellomyces sp. 'palustris']|nr:hypothetical protein SpCBS45565_g01306 [Spizellomyces sp. 'palustris']
MHAEIARVKKVDTRTNQLLDEHGRTRFFRGVNVVFKRPPWHPVLDRFDAVTSFAEEDARLLSSLNVNSIRLGVHWAGVEPTRGLYSSTYIAAIRQIVQTCARYGIYVLLEFHQDVLAPQFRGHGVPDWFVSEDWLSGWKKWLRFPVPNRFTPVRRDADGMPLEDDCKGLTWYLLYFTYAVADAFGRLYNNHGGLLDAFAAYWQHVVEEFKNETNILGYEIMNEPWPGNHWKNPLLLLPGYASGTTLHTMHTHVAQAIRRADPNAIIYFEGATWDVTTKAPCVPGGIEYADRSVLSYHFYRPPQRTDIDTYMKRRKADAVKLGGCGLFMTEWEMWYGNGSDKRYQEMWDTVTAADRHQQNWMGWAYKSFAQGKGSTDGSLFDDETGERRLQFEELWSRTFPTAVSGNVITMKFERDTGRFELAFEFKVSVKEPTEIGISAEIWYPQGYRVEITPLGVALWHGNARTIVLDIDRSTENGTQINVVVERQC